MPFPHDSSHPNVLVFSFSPPFLCSVFCSLAVSPELPPRYLLGQAQRPNTITHVCWYRNHSLSLSDYLCMIQVKMPLEFCTGGEELWDAKEEELAAQGAPVCWREDAPTSGRVAVLIQDFLLFMPPKCFPV